MSARDPVQKREALEAMKQFKDAERMSSSQMNFDRVKREVLEKRAKAAGYVVMFTHDLLAREVPERFNNDLPEIPILQDIEDIKAPEITLPPGKPKRKVKLKSMRRKKQK